jgi:hypothetical protein
MWELLTGDEPYADMHCASIIGKYQIVNTGYCILAGYPCLHTCCIQFALLRGFLCNIGV